MEGILKHRKAVVTVFIVCALICAAMIPFVRVNYNMVDYLPPSAQSTEAVRIMDEEFDQPIPNANVLVHDVTIPQALALKERIAQAPGVESVMWLDDMVDIEVPLPTQDAATVEGYYRDGDALFQVAIADAQETAAVDALRAIVDEAGPGNAVSGDAADTAQMQQSTVEEVMGAVIIVVPIIVFLLVVSTLSWIEPLLFLGAIGISILLNMGTNIVLGEVSFVTNSVSPILQLAVSLDYAIFLLHAFADERTRTASLEEAMGNAMRKSASTIAASAITTLFGFGALAFMQFQIGADLGLNLVKGIVFSFITVIVFLPALTMCLVKAIDKTTHRRLMPSFANIGKPLARLRIPALVLVAVLVVPAFLGQAHVNFTYQNGIPDTNIRTGADTVMIQEEFGQNNAMVVLVPRGDVPTELALSEELASLDAVTSVMSYAKTVGPQIPTGFLGEEVVNQFYSDDWARIILSVDTPLEGEKAFAAVDQIQQTTANYYDSFYTAGQSANLFDMRNIVAVDNVTVSLVAVIAIFLVVAITFRSFGLPLALVFAIECGIWINLSISYFLGVDVNFIGYLVINTVQLGATIDYGILLTTHYIRHRQHEVAPQAIKQALGETFQSLLVSASILATAGFALTASSSLAAVSSLGLLLGRGAIISLVMVTCLLPALLVLCDGFIRRTTWKSGFYDKGASE